MKTRRDPCGDGYGTDPRRNSCMTSKMMGNVLIAQQHYLPSERKGLLHTVNIRVSTLVRLNLYENLSDDFTNNKFPLFALTGVLITWVEFRANVRAFSRD